VSVGRGSDETHCQHGVAGTEPCPKCADGTSLPLTLAGGPSTLEQQRFHILLQADGKLAGGELITTPGPYFRSNAKARGHRIARVRLVIEELETP
jgi:hypothetical protein